jgi:hypothetical protein
MTKDGMRKAQFMGPGTNVLFRLRRGDQGLTPCDRVARRHDIDYALAGSALTKEKQISMVRKADERMVRKLNEIANRGLDYQVNIQQGKLISAKMKMEDFGIMNMGSFSGDLRYYKSKDYVLLIQEREKMKWNGY